MSRRAGVGENPLWAKAPSALLHTPGLWVAVSAGTLLLAVAATFSPVFLSVTERDLLASEIEDPSVTRFGAGISFESSSIPLDRAVNGRPLHEEQERAFSQRAARERHLGPVVEGILSPEIQASAEGGSASRTARLMFRTDAAGHLRILDGSVETPGVLVPEVLARGLGLDPGGTISIRHQDGPPVEVTVSAVYETLYTTPRSGYWRSWSDEIWPCLTCDPPPQPIFMDRGQLLRATSTLGVESAAFGWDAPLRAGTELTAPEAEAIARMFSRFLAEASGSGSPAELFLCCGFQHEPYRTRTALTSAMPSVLTIVDRRMIALEGPVRVLSLAGLLIALITVAAAGWFATAGRRREYMLLFATGYRTSTVGVKGFLESVAPAAAGAAVGLGLTLLLILWLGPEGRISAPALRSSLSRAGIVWLVAAALVGVVTAALFRSHGESAQRSWIGLPIDLALILASVFLLDQVTGAGAMVVDPDTGVETPSLALLALPIATLAGLGGLAARAFRMGLMRVRDRARTRSEALHLAIHRLAGARRLALLLVAAAAASIGLLLHALTVALSLDATVHAKARVFVGSEVAAQIDPSFVPSREYMLPHTVVTRWRAGGRFPATGRRFDLLAVRADTVTDAAFWDDSFAQEPLQDLMAELHRGGEGPLPIVVAGVDDAIPARTTVLLGSTEVAARVVGTAETFPGMTSGEPLVVADVDAVRASAPTDPMVGARVTGEVWARASPSVATRRFIAAGIHPDDIHTAPQVEDLPSIAAARGTFAILAGLGVVSGLLVLVVLIMYVQARQRAQVVSYALARRMGLSRGQNVRALALEVGAMLLTSFAVGSLVGQGISVFVVPELDPLPAIATQPLLRFSTNASVLALMTLVACTAMAAWLGERIARRANVAEVMRVAE